MIFTLMVNYLIKQNTKTQEHYYLMVSEALSRIESLGRGSYMIY